jgi:hypothetical protein
MIEENGGMKGNERKNETEFGVAVNDFEDNYN